MQLVATPLYTAIGCVGPFYRSAIVVRRYEPAATLADMRGTRCVVNEWSSNSGMNLLRAAIAPLAAGAEFFESVDLSGSHRRSIEMVADGEADLAAIDCVSWAHFQQIAPEPTGALRVLGWTETSPSLPYVTAAGTMRIFFEKLERAKGFEPSTPTLARLCSTPELRPRLNWFASRPDALPVAKRRIYAKLRSRRKRGGEERSA